MRLGEPTVDDRRQHLIICVRCAMPVEEARRCYVIPTCYECLPPPKPLPIIQRKGTN